MANKKVLIFHLLDDFDKFHRAPMIKALAKNSLGKFELLCVEPPISFSSLMFWKKRGFDVLPRLRRVQDNLTIFRPVILEGRHFWRALGREGRFYNKLREQVMRAVSAFPLETTPVNWVFRPEQASIIEAFRGAPFVYDCYDDYLHDLASGRRIEMNKALEKQLLNSASVVFVTSELLYKSRGQDNERVFYAPNGVDIELFSRDAGSPISDRYKKPIIGFVGNINDCLDFQALEHAISRLPACSFVFVGPVNTGSVKRLAKLKNFFLAGQVPRNRLHEYISIFDIGLIPYALNEAADARNPYKMWEYFSSGKVVISSPLKELQKFGDVLYFARDGEELVRRIKEVLTTDTSAKAKQGLELAEEHSWHKLTKNVLNILETRI